MIYTVTPAFNIFIGVCRHLSECEQFGTKHIFLNQLNQVTEQDTIIFGAWEPSTYPIAIRRCKAKKKALLFTSPLLQAQMNEPELDYLNTILSLKEKGVLDYLLFADLETYEVFKGDGIFHLPHPCDISKIEVYKKDVPKNNIFCFMPWGNKNKNQICQLAAVKLFQRKHPDVVLYVNGMGPWKRWADKLVKYVDLGFLPREDYYEYINRSTCGIHVTLSESFAYSVLDAFLLEVPIICSPAIDWAPECLQVKNPDNPVEIAELIENMYYYSSETYGQAANIYAIKKIISNNKKARETLKQII